MGTDVPEPPLLEIFTAGNNPEISHSDKALMYAEINVLQLSLHCCESTHKIKEAEELYGMHEFIAEWNFHTSPPPLF